MSFSQVQHKGGAAAGASNLQLTLTSGLTVGNRVIAGAAWWKSSSPGTAASGNVTDGGSNTYNLTPQGQQNTGDSPPSAGAIWTSQIGTTGTTVKFTPPSGASTDIGFSVSEVSGLDTSSGTGSVDVEHKSSGTAGTVAIGPATAAAAGEYVFVLAHDAGWSDNFGTPGASWTALDSQWNDANLDYGTAYLTAGSTTSALTATFTGSAANFWAGLFTIFKLAAGGGGTTHPVTLSVTTVSVPALSKSVGKVFSVTTTTLPSLIKQIGKGLAVTTTTVPSLLKQIGKGLAVTTVSIPSLAAAKLKVVVLAVTTVTVPKLTKLVGKVLPVTTVSVPGLIKLIGKVLPVTTVSVPSLTKLISKTFSVTTTTIPSVAKTKVKIVVLAVVSATVPTLTKLIGKVLPVTTTSAPSLTKLIGKVLPVTTTSAPSITKQISKTLRVTSVSIASLVALLRSGAAIVAAKVGLTDFAAFNVAVADKAAYSVAVGDSAADSVAVADQTP